MYFYTASIIHDTLVHSMLTIVDINPPNKVDDFKKMNKVNKNVDRRPIPDYNPRTVFKNKLW